MVSLGMFASRAARMAERRRALWSGSPPPLRAATVTSRISLVNRTPLVAPIASFLRLILVHLLWPDIAAPRTLADLSAASSTRALCAAMRNRRRRAFGAARPHGGLPGEPPLAPHVNEACSAASCGVRSRLSPAAQALPARPAAVRGRTESGWRRAAPARRRAGAGSARRRRRSPPPARASPARAPL